MPAAQQRNAICPFRHRFTFPVLSRQIEIIDSMGLVECRVGASVGGIASAVTVSVSLKPLAQAGGGSPVGLGQFRAESLKRGFSRNRALGVVGRTHRPLSDVPQLLRQPVPHVPDLVFLTALDDGLVEDIVHGAAERLRSVDHDQNRACHVQTAFTEAGQQFTHHGGILRGPARLPAGA